MVRIALAAAILVLVPSAAHADPADISAAARGVVRIVIVEEENGRLFPVSHGTGFAVTPERIITNAHVVAEARDDATLAIGIVPSDGGEPVYGRLIAYSPRNDLALIATTADMDLPPLTLAGNASVDSGPVVSIGYPFNVDAAQGLQMADFFRPQPPVKANGTLSGRRPSRRFDTLLHTASIARGSSGGPLVDECGRVLGVNSFGTNTGGPDAEFFFAVSMKELLPFLRANEITPRINSMPCRSLAELEAEERDRAEAAQRKAEAEQQASAEADARRRASMREDVRFAVMAERENGMALAFLLLVAALGAGGVAVWGHAAGASRQRAIAGGIALVALAGGVIAWLSRPAYAEIDDRLQDRLREEMASANAGVIDEGVVTGAAQCRLVPERSRVTGQAAASVQFDWDAGCVNGRTQYGLADGRWSRAFVPNEDAVVSVNSYDPDTGEYRNDRYLLGREAMAQARKARGSYKAPACPADEASARSFGERQKAVLSLLPQRPNERVVYDCDVAASSK
ncbi:Serine protease [Paraurantiacibacter namhicola]|uniref:Serine protease n=2 Tax=Paraurantiacibacter namhicola TaxID=645517 RepID=A0A1C7D7T2_9SPHN|nr:Serine protease [Paraurantiacibacter namhicola]